MSNRRFLNNNAIAKIQIILVFAMVLLFGNSCERKDLYLRVNGIQIEVEMYDVRLDLLWGIDWETEWQYTWNESAADFGTIGYTKPELVKGTIYNVDGIGNRVGAIIYGPRKVIFVVGRNKIHRTKEEAWDHLRNVICPKHCITNKKPNPCVKVGRCVDCSLETMECKVTSKLSYALPNREYIVVLVNEDLGY